MSHPGGGNVFILQGIEPVQTDRPDRQTDSSRDYADNLTSGGPREVGVSDRGSCLEVRGYLWVTSSRFLICNEEIIPSVQLRVVRSSE